jgi:1-acyl-sn-glycerol-3-phosphate acyltransferase
MVEALQTCAFLLKRDKIICIFPEGQRTIDGRVKGFKKGIGILAKELDIQLVPAYIDGAFRSWPRSRLLPKPSKITVSFGKPIRFSGFSSQLGSKPDIYEEVTDKLREQLILLSDRLE